MQSPQRAGNGYLLDFSASALRLQFALACPAARQAADGQKPEHRFNFIQANAANISNDEIDAWGDGLMSDLSGNRT